MLKHGTSFFTAKFLVSRYIFTQYTHKYKYRYGYRYRYRYTSENFMFIIHYKSMVLYLI